MVNSYRVCAEFFNMGFFDFFVVDFLFFIMNVVQY